MTCDQRGPQKLVSIIETSGKLCSNKAWSTNVPWDRYKGMDPNIFNRPNQNQSRRHCGFAGGSRSFQRMRLSHVGWSAPQLVPFE